MMNERHAEISQLLTRDVDEYHGLSGAAGSSGRDDLLLAAMQRLPREMDTLLRYKLLQLAQALLAEADEATLSPPLFTSVAMALLSAAHADDSTERLAALRVLGVLISRTDGIPPVAAEVIRSVFDRAQRDASPWIRTFATEMLAPGGLLSRRLDALELEEAAGSRKTQR